MRYTRQQHLRTAREFETLRSIGIRRECGFFSLNFKALPDRAPPLRRIGVIASRRVGNAVERNRAKRLLRETFRLNQEMLPESCDIVCVARRSILKAGQKDVERRFKGAIGALTRETE